jgi:hypothetical protein
MHGPSPTSRIEKPQLAGGKVATSRWRLGSMSLVRNGVGKSRDFRGKCGGFLCVLVSTSAEKLQFSGGGGELVLWRTWRIKNSGWVGFCGGKMNLEVEKRQIRVENWGALDEDGLVGVWNAKTPWTFAALDEDGLVWGLKGEGFRFWQDQELKLKTATATKKGLKSQQKQKIWLHSLSFFLSKNNAPTTAKQKWKSQIIKSTAARRKTRTQLDSKMGTKLSSAHLRWRNHTIQPLTEPLQVFSMPLNASASWGRGMCIHLQEPLAAPPAFLFVPVL